MSCEIVLCEYHGDLLLLVGLVVYHPAPLSGVVHGDGLPPVLTVEVLELAAGVLDLPHLLALQW